MRYVRALLLIILVPGLLQAEFFRGGMPDFKAKTNLSVKSGGVPSFAHLAKELSPTVVNIAVETESSQEEADSLVPDFPFFKNIPGQPLRSLGSGFIVSEDGYVVTNFHVISKAKKIVVRLLDDKTEYEAKLVGKDDKTDLALIKIKPKGKLKTVVAGDSDKIQVGEWVLAIGNQFQLGQTVTAGIISAKSRKVPTRLRGPYDDFIQTDASINPGSSGGPLFNRFGQVVGINTAIFSPGRNQFGGTGFNIGIGFAIPVNLAKTILIQLRDKGKVTRGLLGVVIQRLDNDLAEALGLSTPYGALVADVISNSPASKAGFKLKDVIVQYNGKKVREHDDLPLLVANTTIGTKVEVMIIRDGKLRPLHPVITELTGDPMPKLKEPVIQKANSLGLIVQDVTKEIAASLGVATTKGVVVNSVEPDSPAFMAGMVRGDIIEEINGKPIGNSEVLAKTLKILPVGKPILVLVRRREGTRFLTLKIKKKS